MSAREVYTKYCKGGKSNIHVSAGTFNPECNAKTTKNALRLVLSLHVLWHRCDKSLNQLTDEIKKIDVEPLVISVAKVDFINMKIQMEEMQN